MTSIINSGVHLAIPAAPVISVGVPGGNLSAGVYTYKITYVTNNGESLPSLASNSITALSSSSISLTLPAASVDGNVIGRNLYRTTAGGASWRLVNQTGFIPNLTSTGLPNTSIVDTLADSALSATTAPVVNLADSVQLVKGYVSFQQPTLPSVTSAITALSGGGQTGATALTTEYNFVTGSAFAADSCILPLLAGNLIGLKVIVRNTSGNSINIFPAVGQFINSLAVNTALAVANNNTTTFVAISATTWNSA